MVDFHTSLLREKFTLRETEGDMGDALPVIALSNRMVLQLTSRYGQETFVIRTQNMHTCARLAAVISKEFYAHGPLLGRTIEYRWADAWRLVTKGYEEKWNPAVWGCIYHKGKILFESGEHHQLLDLIEQCDFKNKHEYEKSLALAENAFMSAGKAVKIDYDGNFALMVNVKDGVGRCGIILRSPNKTMTFNFTAREREDGRGRILRPSQCLTVCAAFLEGMQLAFNVGMVNKKRELGLTPKYSPEDKKALRAVERLGALNLAVTRFERVFELKYRPERPVFGIVIKEAETFASSLFKSNKNPA